jgi:hypothetical protein
MGFRENVQVSFATLAPYCKEARGNSFHFLRHTPTG